MNNEKIKPNARELALKHGFSYPSNDELIMMILGTGTRELPVEILAKKVSDIIDISSDEDIVKNLLSIRGMGNSKALAIAAAMELGRRKYRYKEAVIKKPSDIIPFIRNYSMSNKEHFICISLNGANEILKIRVVSIGTIDRTLVHPREIFSEVIKENATAIIVSHNHPSGNCEPSSYDINTTKTLKYAADILGISFLDHIIFSQNNYFSFMEHDLLKTEGLDINSRRAV
ncbi:MAG: DNA repair protein RadC [Treponema sp.]|nr:DNA repair protein RadC [Treponema sp.]